MSSVFISPDRAQEMFGIDIAEIERVTGRTVVDVERYSTWADDPDGEWGIPERLRKFVHKTPADIPGHRRIMSKITLYFDMGDEE